MLHLFLCPIPYNTLSGALGGIIKLLIPKDPAPLCVPSSSTSSIVLKFPAPLNHRQHLVVTNFCVSKVLHIKMLFFFSFGEHVLFVT